MHVLIQDNKRFVLDITYHIKMHTISNNTSQVIRDSQLMQQLTSKKKKKLVSLLRDHSLFSIPWFHLFLVSCCISSKNTCNGQLNLKIKTATCSTDWKKWVSNFGAFKPLTRALIYLKIHYHSHQTGIKGRIFFVGLLFTIPLAERRKGCSCNVI